MHKKILTTFLILFFTVIIFNINSVFGVGIVSQCWVNDVDGDGKQDLIFRTYTGPHSSEIRKYYNTASNELVENGKWNYVYNGNTKRAKWIYVTEKGTSLPETYTFKTIGFAFHTEPMSNYPEGSKSSSKMGYTSISEKYTLTESIGSVQGAIDNAKSIYSTPTVNKTYSSTVFYEIMRMAGTYSNMSWGTGLKITGLSAAGQTQYRHTIIRLGTNTDVYIADNVVYNDDLVQVVSKAKKLGSTEGCYVSNILTSKAYGKNNDYEVSRTAVDFLKQYDKNWSIGILGKENPNNKSFESAINLYDNKLIFPQLSKRTVLVRHINIGNNTVISKDIVNNGERIDLA